jgi:hypothetical protein
MLADAIIFTSSVKLAKTCGDLRYTISASKPSNYKIMKIPLPVKTKPCSNIYAQIFARQAQM